MLQSHLVCTCTVPESSFWREKREELVEKLQELLHDAETGALKVSRETWTFFESIVRVIAKPRSVLEEDVEEELTKFGISGEPGAVGPHVHRTFFVSPTILKEALAVIASRYRVVRAICEREHLALPHYIT